MSKFYTTRLLFQDITPLKLGYDPNNPPFFTLPPLLDPPNSLPFFSLRLHLSHQTPPQSKAGTSNPGQVHGSGFVYNTNSLYSSINSTEGENGEAVKAGVTTVGFPPPMLGMNENSNSMSHSSFSKDLVSLPLETVQSVVYGHLKQVTGNGDGQQVVTSSVVGETPPEDAKKKKRKSVPKKNERAKRQKEVSSQPTPITNTAKQHISFNSPSDSATPAATPTPTTDDEKKGAKHKSSKSIQVRLRLDRSDTNMPSHHYN